MSFLKFNKAELVNLGYSLKREIISANKTGAYCNTSIVTCNTRRYHGLLAVTLDRFGGDKFLLLSSLDESFIIDGKRFNLGIHRYGDIYEPRGNKYVVDFVADPVPQVTYKVGDIVFVKSLLLDPQADRIMIKYDMVKAPSKVKLILKPFLAFRNVHALTHCNDAANTGYTEIPGGASFRLYSEFPDLHIQANTTTCQFVPNGVWFNGITYSDEYRRGFDCTEDLFTPGNFEVAMKEGDSIVVAAGTEQVVPSSLKRRFSDTLAKMPEISGSMDQLRRCADTLITNHNNRKKIVAGLSWGYTGLLRETLIALPGLTLYRNGDTAEFEAILDNLIEDNQERFRHRTTQIESPLVLACALQSYMEFPGTDEKKIWKKYGRLMIQVLESYLPGHRNEVAMQPNGLLWAQKENTALTWMNAYVDGHPVTERAGFQVEVNAYWYNAICFVLEMLGKYNKKENASLIEMWTAVKNLVWENYIPTFWSNEYRCLADYVDGYGQHNEIRPNQLMALCVKYTPFGEEYYQPILRVVDSELITSRGIRTLSPRDINYKGVYEGSQRERDLAFHNGSAWPFLLGQYVGVSFKVKGPSFYKKAEWLVEGFYNDLGKHGVGTFAELYDGDPPHEPHGTIASALSTSALLTVSYLMDIFKEAK